MSESGGGAARARKANQAFHMVGETRPDVGILILDGFTGSPAEMRPLGLALHVLTTDVEKDEVAASAIAFVRRLI